MIISIEVTKNGFIFHESESFDCVSDRWVFETPDALAAHVLHWAKGKEPANDEKEKVTAANIHDRFSFKSMHRGGPVE